MTASGEQAAKGIRAYWGAAGLAVVTALLSVWFTIVRDDGNGLSAFMVIMAAVVGAFAAWFDAAGLARAMLGAAIMQVLAAIAIATAPVTAAMPGGSQQVLTFGGVFAVLWLAAAALFRIAARGAGS